MTIDNMMECLQKAKAELGGDTEIRLHVSANGNGDYVEIQSLDYSGIFGLSCDVSTPWWAFKGSQCKW